MKSTISIKSNCIIKENKIILNDHTIFESDLESFSEFSKSAIRHFNIDYPKFFKMDNLSKLAFLGAEIILEKEDMHSKNIALVFANKSSSLDTDVKYNNSILDKKNYYPSPAVFVYTLPNICLGEISIRHQLKSENSFFIFDAFNEAFMKRYAQVLIDSGKADEVLCGWVEYFEENYSANFFLITNTQK